MLVVLKKKKLKQVFGIISLSVHNYKNKSHYDERLTYC